MTGPRSTREVDRSEGVLAGVFGRPRSEIVRGHGCWIEDADGRRHLDLLAGIAVNSLGHGHPALVEAVTCAAQTMLYVSNFFVTPPQVELAERLLGLCGAPDGSRVFLCNSGTEANEMMLKLARRTGRRGVVALEGAFHGRTTGALAMTHKAAYRQPFEPLVGDVVFVPPNDEEALRCAVDDNTAMVVLEPTQGEAGVLPLSAEYLRLARSLTERHGALLALDEVQTGIGRTGRWFDHERAGIRPDAMSLAKGLGGGVPIGAVVTYGRHVSGLLAPGQHGTTFGGNPLACSAALAVLRVIEDDGLLENARAVGDHLRRGVLGLAHPLVAEVRGAGLMLAIELTDDVAPRLQADLEAAGVVVNAVRPSTLRLVPPLVLTREEADIFATALAEVLARAGDPVPHLQEAR